MQITMDKQAIKASFSKAAGYYDLFADLQRDVGHQLVSLMGERKGNIDSVLDLGCGTGYFSTLLNEINGKKTSLTCFDLSPQMLQQASLRQLENCQFVEGDIDHLPFSTHQFDLVFSNLVLQWSEHLASSLKQIKASLNQQGVLYFSTLLNGSLLELKQAWKQVDGFPHINAFLTEKEVKEALIKSGFTHFIINKETRVKKYNSIIDVMKALKGIGANHVHHRNKVRMTGKRLLQQLALGYAPYRDEHGFYNLSYQVCYVTAFKEPR